MNNSEPSKFFGDQQAAGYDKQWQKISAIREALQLLMRVEFSQLPTEARVLCVGVGTGSEVIYLAEQFPGWSFTLVEPSQPMLDVCRQRIEGGGLTARCTFHDGYLDSLPATAPFDAATALLVSQFILENAERREFFAQISARLLPGGHLINAELALDASGLSGSSLFEVWLEMQRYTGVPEEFVEKLRSVYGRDVAVSTPQQIEEMIASSGFEAPTQFFQALLIRAWYTQKAG